MNRVGRIAALIACLMHALVLPALSASMKADRLASAELARAGAVICHTVDVADAAGTPAQGPASTTGAEAPLSDGSGKDTGDDCQICKGLAAVQFAVLVSVVLGLAETPAPAVFARPERINGAGITSASPRNRGPPHLA